MFETENGAVAAEPAATPAPEAGQNSEQELPQSLDSLPAQQQEAVQQEGQEPGDQQAQEEEFTQVEWNGQQYQMPKGMGEVFAQHKEFQDREEAFASQSNEVAQMHERMAAQMQFMPQVAALEHEGRAIRQELEELANVDWAALNEQDPYQAQRAFNYQQQLQARFQELEQDHGALTQQMQDMQEQGLQQRVQAAEAHALQLPGWNDEMANKISQFAQQTLNLSEADMRASISPKFIDLLYYSYHGHAAVQAAGRPQAKTIAPIKTVSGGQSPTANKNPGEMNMDEYAAWRASQGA